MLEEEKSKMQMEIYGGGVKVATSGKKDTQGDVYIYY